MITAPNVPPTAAFVELRTGALSPTGYAFLRTLRGLVVSGFGGDVVSITAADSPYSVAVGTAVVLVDATFGPVSVTLPALATVVEGYSINVKKIDATANAVTVSGDALIDGAATLVWAVAYKSYALVPNGAWWVV